MILYEYHINDGHYCLLINNNPIEYFDSIYQYPDKVLKDINKKVRDELYENKKYLLDLLK